MAFIEVRNLLKRFGKVVAVNHVDLEIQKGEMLTLLGPSGCGKTTTLRCIAGLEKPEEGDIIIDGKSMLAQGFVPPSRRGIGMVFQNYAVWPHMKVFNNVAYGLKLQKLPSRTIRDMVGNVLDLVGLGGLNDRYPGQLSGGQQQRVALARALVRNPKVLLLDEPLSNLDAKLREKMRFEIKSLVRRMGITAVYVTHDQAEAMVISDRIAVMDAGNVVQIGSAREIYERPADRFVADFIGTMNFIPGEVIEVLDETRMVRVKTEFSERLLCTLSDGMHPKTGERLYASIRPEDVQLFPDPPEESENVVGGTIANKAYLGNFLFVFVSVNEATIRVQMTHYTPEEEGQKIYLYLDPRKCMALP
jgi:iron(III) transport system ATP-binding protein